MSRSVDLFIQSELHGEELAEAIGQLVERPLRPGPDPESWVLQQGEDRAVLRAHPYVDDTDLVFSNYRYALSASVPNEQRVQDAPVTDMLRRVADRLHRSGTMSVLLVLDLQYRDRDRDADRDRVPDGPPEAEPTPVPVFDGPGE